MDNTTIAISDVAVEPSTLAAGLAQAKIKLTRRSDPAMPGEQMLFSLPIGPHQQRWLFRVGAASGTITCSGGVTKTFFGHNLYVFTNEGDQLEAIAKILTDALRKVPGLTVPEQAQISVDRAELTRHHALPPEVSKKDALERLDRMQMVLLPTRYSNEGRTLDDPGTIRIGKTKSSRVCRIYDPAIKFAKRPAHIPMAFWNALCTSRLQELRVEIMLNKRELKSAKLDVIPAWHDQTRVLKQVEKRYRRFGLSVPFRSDKLGVTSLEMKEDHPAWYDAAMHFFSGGNYGTPLNPRSGSTTRFKGFMLDRGYCVDIPFDRHVHLAHGLHEHLQPATAATIAVELKEDKALFRKWWLPK